MTQIFQKLRRKQKRPIKKLKHSSYYTFVLSSLFFFFPPVKKFIIHPVKGFQKVFGMISFSVMKVFGFKVGLLDDFIVHKKLRGRGVAQELFERSEQELKKEDVDFVILTSRADRKASHKFYKKAGMTIIGLSIGIIAFKKLKK